MLRPHALGLALTIALGIFGSPPPPAHAERQFRANPAVWSSMLDGSNAAAMRARAATSAQK